MEEQDDLIKLTVQQIELLEKYNVIWQGMNRLCAEEYLKMLLSEPDDKQIQILKQHKIDWKRMNYGEAKLAIDGIKTGNNVLDEQSSESGEDNHHDEGYEEGEISLEHADNLFQHHLEQQENKYKSKK